MKPTLYIVCGLPFSDKTFLSKQIEQYIGCVRISYDELWRELKSQTGQSFGWDDLSKLAQQRIGECLDRGESVIYDTLNDTVGNRGVLRQLAYSHDANAIVVFVKTPLKIIRERQNHNQKSNERHSVPEDKLQEAIARFEEPLLTEEPIIFTLQSDFTEWAQRIKELS